MPSAVVRGAEPPSRHALPDSFVSSKQACWPSPKRIPERAHHHEVILLHVSARRPAWLPTVQLGGQAALIRQVLGVSGNCMAVVLQVSMLAAVDQAITQLQATQQGPGVLCICGSLHVVAEALSVLDLQH